MTIMFALVVAIAVGFCGAVVLGVCAIARDLREARLERETMIEQKRRAWR